VAGLSLHRSGNARPPERNFLEQHWDLIVAADFFTIEAWTRRGLQRFIVLFFIQVLTRKAEIAGIAPLATRCDEPDRGQREGRG
jgi:hypothetical protein